MFLFKSYLDIGKKKERETKRDKERDKERERLRKKERKNLFMYFLCLSFI